MADEGDTIEPVRRKRGRARATETEDDMIMTTWSLSRLQNEAKRRGVGTSNKPKAKLIQLISEYDLVSSSFV